MTGAAGGAEGALQAVAGYPSTRLVVIEWVEESHHRVVVRVPEDFVAHERDMTDELGRLYCNGFQGLERKAISVSEASGDDPDAEYFDPPAA